MGEGVAPGFCVGAVVGLGVVPPPEWLATLNGVVIVVSPDEVTIFAVIECTPSATVVVSHAVADPSAAVPAKSIGLECSTCLGVPLAAALSSQKLAEVTPATGVTKTYALPLTVLPDRTAGDVRFDDAETITEKALPGVARATIGTSSAVMLATRTNFLGLNA